MEVLRERQMTRIYLYSDFYFKTCGFFLQNGHTSSVILEVRRYDGLNVGGMGGNKHFTAGPYDMAHHMALETRGWDCC